MGILEGIVRHRDSSGSTSHKSWDGECKARSEKFGYAQVPATEVCAAFEQIVVPSCPRFIGVKKSLLAREISPDLFHLIGFGAGKGGIYSFRWGLSLAYVPHEWDERCKYHRTLKSVTFDLFEDPVEFLIQDLYSAEGWKYMADTLHGSVCFRTDLSRAWANLSPVITNWFSTVQDLQGVLGRANQHVRHNWRGFRHFPDPGFVLAFTLARLGRQAEALAALGELRKEDQSRYGSHSLEYALDQTRSVE